MSLLKSVKKLDIRLGVADNSTHRNDHGTKAKRSGVGVQRLADDVAAFKSLLKSGWPAQLAVAGQLKK
jgi:hypothetical protein